MVMLTRTLTLDKDIINPRVVLVTDRIDLDRQLKNTFKACGLEPVQATSGRSLLKYVHDLKSGIITTLIHKFEKAMNTNKVKDDSSEIFVLVDESHRTN
jgi:type I restriction enzyme R subunit